MPQKPRLIDRFRYKFDNFMSKGGFSVFSALIFLFFGAFILMSLVRIATALGNTNNEASLTDQMWRVFLQISDAGAVAEDSQSSWPEIIVAITTIFLGLILFSSLVAFITSQFEAKLAELKKGKSRVVESGHTLILGFGERVTEIISELITAKESEGQGTIVILSEHDKEEVDDYFRENLGKTGKIKIVTRNGSTSSLRSLKNVGIERARSVIMLSAAGQDSPEEDKAQADARQLKTLMAILTCCQNNPPPLIVEFHKDSKSRLGKKLHKNIVVLNENLILSKLIVQTSRISGLAQVYDNLVGFDGCEMYFFPMKNFLNKTITYRDLVFSFSDSTVMGYKDLDGRIYLNPPGDTHIKNNAEVLLLAEDDSTINPQKKLHIPEKTEFSPSPPRLKQKEKQLIVGWNQKTLLIIQEYIDYLVEGSSLDVLVAEITEDIKLSISSLQSSHPQIKIRLLNGNSLEDEIVKSLKPHEYDNVILLTKEKENGELQDAETIASLLVFRVYFSELQPGSYHTQLITEVADSENTEIIQQAGAKDFLISNQFVSKICAQVSESPEIYRVYEDLFSSEGCEIYLKPLSLYTSIVGNISFGQITAAALARGETCLGIRSKAFEDDKDSNFGIVLNPDKSRIFNMNPDDWIITLAEDES